MAKSAQIVNYTLTRGLPWERLIIVKDRRTHRNLYPSDARAYIKTGDITLAEITTTLNAERGILLNLNSEETQDLPLGLLNYDVIATIRGVQKMVAQGTINVYALNNITPLEDTDAMELRFKQRTDYRRTFTWRDSEGEILYIQSAFMQAKNSLGNTALDLRWFATTPDEATVVALPERRRGYLAPAAGATLELHVSDKNTIEPGAYSYDIFVQDSAGDWDCLTSGTLVVEAAISAPPT
jgi:hypothetical protein